MASDRDPPRTPVRAGLEDLLAEMRRLEAEGRLDAEARDRLKARSDAIARQAREESDAALASARAAVRKLQHPDPMKWWQRAAAGLLVALFVGCAIDLTAGFGFIFARLEAWRELRPWTCAALTPVVAWALWIGERRSRAMHRRAPTRSLRWGLLFPCAVAMGVFVLVAAPLGWAAAYTRVAGSRVEGAEGRLASLHEPSPGSRSCRQRGDVTFAGQTATLCLSGRLVGAMPASGDRVVIAGWQSAAGLYVERIERR